MEKIFGTRGIGKTTQMLQYCNGKGIYIVCHNRDEVDRLWKIILENKYDIPQPIEMNQSIASNNKVFVDNVDLIIYRLNHYSLEFIKGNFIVNIDKTLTNLFKIQHNCEVIGYTITIE